MKMLTFRGGVHPEYNKDISIREPLRRGALPKTFVVPLSQHIGAPCEALVKKGDCVEEAQLIGSSASFISASLHSPVSGTVADIQKAFHPALGPVLSVYIERDQTKPHKEYQFNDAGQLSRDELISRVKDAGLVGMGGAAFPTHVKLKVPDGKKIETLVINGCECEPYLTCDHMLMTHKTQEILKGIKLIISILQPKDVYIAVENNKKAAIFAFLKAKNKSSDKVIRDIKVVALKTKYPQGGEKQIIKAISGREVPPGGLPLDIGFLVQNVGTVFAVYEAVCYAKPLIERLVTISGDCLDKPGNYLIRMGTTVKDIMDEFGIGMIKRPRKIVFGGPMMGFAQPDMNTPILKSTSGVLFLSDKAARDFEEITCIRCGKCVDVCPVNLVPTDIMRFVKKEYWDRLDDLYVADCIECGSCAYICPSRIPLVRYIKEGKFMKARK